MWVRLKKMLYAPGCGFLLTGRIFPVVRKDRKNYYIPVGVGCLFPVSKQDCEKVTFSFPHDV